MWVFPWIKLSWHSCSLWDKLGWLNWFWQFLCEGLSLIRKDSMTHMHGFGVYALCFCTGLISGKLCGLLLMFWTCFTSLSVYFLLLFFLCRSSSSSLCTVFDSVSSNIDKVFSINPSANVFVFGDFNVHHKDWLTFSGGTDRPGELCYNFYLKWLKRRWLTFLLGTLTVTLTVLLFLISFFLLTLVFVLQWFPLHWEILILLSQFPLTSS